MIGVRRLFRIRSKSGSRNSFHSVTMTSASAPLSAAYPFSASAQEQLYRAWLVWKRDGGSWRAWGAVGAACSQ